jgi:hypothetical protein
MSEGGGNVKSGGSEDRNTQTQTLQVLCAYFRARPETLMVVLVRANAARTPTWPPRLGNPRVLNQDLHSVPIEINSAIYNNDSNSTYPFPDMSNSQTSATQRWHAELDTAIDLYRAEKFEECIAHTNTVFRDNTPLYPRLRYCMLLASCLDDWYEAEEMRFHAENTYTSWCLFNPINSFPGADKVRSDLRANLDRIADDLKTSRPEDWKETQRFWNVTEAAEAQEEYAAERSEEEKDEDEEDEDEEDEEEEDEEEEEEEEDVAVTQSDGEGAVVRSEKQVAVAQSEEEAVLGAGREEDDAGLGAAQSEDNAVQSEEDAVLGA